jgi:voltage-gated potassium channel
LPPDARRREGLAVAEPKISGSFWRPEGLRRRVHDILDDATTHPSGQALHRGLIALVLISVMASVLETVPSLEARFRPLFLSIEIIACAVFTVEYAARLWTATEHPPWRGLAPWRARLRHALSPGGVIDLVSIVPLYASMILGPDLGVLILFRLLRFLKLGRYSPGARSLLDAMSRERRALGHCAMILAALVLIAATLMHLVEGKVQPDKLGTIPDAMYWAVVTLGTVGYGDVVPVTPVGKIIASITALLGLVSFAMPVGIIGTAFAEAIQRREFVVTWSMVARVPIFAEMAAGEIAEVMRFLHARTVQPGDVIVRRGEAAHSMYFITAGEVEVELQQGAVILGEGEFFGELAILDEKRRSATVRATTTVRLLVLDAADFRSILLHYPELSRRVAHARARRDASAYPEAGSDLTQGEMPEVRGEFPAKHPG